MEDSGDERGSNSLVSDAESDSEAENVGHDRTQWAALKLGLDGSNTPGHFPSTFDAYFTQASRTSRTSSNVFSQLIPPLTPEEYHERINALKNMPELDERMTLLESSHASYFPAFLTELATGFNILFYGFGSKRKLLNKFAKSCAKKGHVVVANGFFPSFTLKDLLASCEQIVGAPDVPNTGSGHEAQCRRILAKYIQKPVARHLFIVIHNIDSAAFRTERARSCLASLASHPSIHLISSVDHIMAPMLFSTTDNFGRSDLNAYNIDRKLPSGGFSWVWHDLTTMQPYDFELAYADHTSYAGASATGQRGSGHANASAALGGGTISEGAARHVLASVTQKAKRLFALLCTRQCATIDAAAAETGAPVQTSSQIATSYELLFAAARDEFIATNDTAMRALLGEFRDHGLVVSTSSPDGGDSLWIPLPKVALVRLTGDIN
ncbi:hypothetical protein EW145_g4826 [Phellinidium pouzarii]|uniref:Origin recognition complex subunit 2 n=1 Tax=Phellinidium pouzarii TaxID=167371 RepID=A0A4S4L400_9AGAM|nr:hypothetical protein EW145_g4826 [Phellinidium pouzarii]